MGRLGQQREKSRRGRECGRRKWKQRELKTLEVFGKTKPRQELFAAGKRQELGSWCNTHVGVLSLPMRSFLVSGLLASLSAFPLTQKPKVLRGFWTLYEKPNCFLLIHHQA